MKHAIYIMCLILFGALAITLHKNKAYKEEIATLSGNESTLLNGIETYKIADSLKAVRVGVLELEIDDYKRHRAQDAELISQLKAKGRKLESVVSSQSQTIVDLKAISHDSIVIRDNYIIDTIKCVQMANKWVTFDGCFDGNHFDGTFESRDSLLIAETVEYKRFLGFLWRTKKVKNRRVDVVNRNPYTKIDGFEFVVIRK